MKRSWRVEKNLAYVKEIFGKLLRAPMEERKKKILQFFYTQKVPLQKKNSQI